MKDLIKKIKALSANTSIFNEWEQGFIAGLADRVEKYGESTSISEKQKSVINKLHAKIGESKQKADKPAAASKTKVVESNANADPFAAMQVVEIVQDS